MTFFNKSFSFLPVLIGVLFMVSCTKKESIPPTAEDPLASYKVVDTLKDESYIIVLYSNTGALTTGYNDIRAKVWGSNGQPLLVDSINWIPEMHMMSMSHGCPFTPFTLVSSEHNIWQAEAVFTMASNNSEYWSCSFTVYEKERSTTITKTIPVVATSNRTVQSFVGSDNLSYAVAQVPLVAPHIGSNMLNAVLYRMNSHHVYEAVTNAVINIDPRMPSMNNHSSPNNVPLTYKHGALYEGAVNFSMTGYWTINLQIVTEDNTVIKGEEISDTVPLSSIYFDIEF